MLSSESKGTRSQFQKACQILQKGKNGISNEAVPLVLRSLIWKENSNLKLWSDPCHIYEIEIHIDRNMPLPIHNWCKKEKSDF